jgi:hypothetical protein
MLPLFEFSLPLRNGRERLFVLALRGTSALCLRRLEGNEARELLKNAGLA